MPPIMPLSPAKKPSRIVDSAWLEHGPFAQWLITALQPRLTVELGSHNGYSFCCFCEQLVRNGGKGRVIAIDTWQGDEHAGAYGDKIYDTLRTYIDANYAAIAEMKRMYFSEALTSVPDGSVDLLHVDGRHFYDDVVEDFTSWMPKLSDRSVVLFHDTQVREHGFGVYKYWAELEKQYPTFEFHHGFGLGVLGFGKDLPAEAAQLLAQGSQPESAAITRAAFAAEGAEIKKIWKRKRAVARGINRLKRTVAAVTGTKL